MWARGKAIEYDQLMACAKDPKDSLTQAFAGMIQSATRISTVPPHKVMGMTPVKFADLLENHFPGSWDMLFDGWQDDDGSCQRMREGEIQDLLDLLMEHRSNESDQSEWLAYAIAMGCMGDNHLYQDMGLPNRQALSSLLKQNFETLHDKNAGNMKWKKFFYKQLCDRAEVSLCKAPSCNVCNDYASCFGPEDDTGMAALANLSHTS